MNVRSAMMRNPRARLFGAVLLAVLFGSADRAGAAASVSAAATEDYSTWLHSAKIRFNTTSAGANVAANVKDFPVLVRFPSGSKVFAQSLAGGSDLRFADADGTHLAFQIERWDSAQGKAEAWVRVPQIDGNSDQDYITAYWGKPHPDSVSDGTKVFDAANGFLAAWHLGESGTKARANATGAGNNATPVNYDGSERCEGVIGMADSLKGAAETSDYLDAGSGFTDLGKGFTMSVWAYPTAMNDFARFFDFGGGMASDNFILSRRDTSNVIVVHVYAGATQIAALQVNHGLDENKWALLAVTVNSGGNAISFYKNGVLMGSTVTLNVPINNVLRTHNYMGHSNWPLDGYYRGKLDEPEVHSVPRDSNWLELAYETQRPDAKALSIEYVADTKLILASQPVSQSIADGATAQFSVMASSPRALNYQWFKDGGAIAGANAATFQIAAASLKDAGGYSCRVSDGVDTVFSATAGLLVGEDYSTWAYSRRIGILSKSSGANLKAAVNDVALLIRLDTTNFVFNQAANDGSDIRFDDPNGVPLPFQIERWNITTAMLAKLWVRVPVVAAADDKGYVTMHWGKPGAQSIARNGTAFAASAGYRAYWPFNEDAGDAFDIGPSSLTATDNGVQESRPGLIGNGFTYNGNGSTLLPAAATLSLKAFTVTLWARERVSAANADVTLCPTMFSLTRTSTGGSFGLVSRGGEVAIWNGLHADNSITKVSSGDSLSDGQWHFLVLAYNGSALSMYQDGNPVVGFVADTVTLAPVSAVVGAQRGANGNYSSFFNGDIDAVQILSQAKSADWIKVQYLSQRLNATFMDMGTGASGDPQPAAPTVTPPAGVYTAAIHAQLSAATDARIFYTLDGTNPDTLNKAASVYSGPIAISRSCTLKAAAVRNGKSGAVLSVAYIIGSLLGTGTSSDTLSPGGAANADSAHAVIYPGQTGPSVLLAEHALVPAPAGFDRYGPLLSVAIADSQSAFPGLQVTTADTSAALYRKLADGSLVWTKPKDGQWWIPAAGSYFWGRDTSAPRVRLADLRARGSDSLRARFVVEDNVAALFGTLRVRNGSGDSLAWKGNSGDTLDFDVALPAKASTPLEIRCEAGDHSLSASYPAGAAYYSPARALPAFSVQADVKPGLQWKLAGIPMPMQSPLSVHALAAVSGTSDLHAAVWRTRSDVEGDYDILADSDTLPTAQGFWIASQSGAAAFTFPPSRAPASGDDGLFPVALKQGWNLVTCPALRPLLWPVSRSDSDAYLHSNLKGLRGYDGSGYTHVDTLRPWEGYYVYTRVDTMLRLGPARAAPKLSAPKVASAGRMRIELDDGAGSDLELGAVGFAKPGLGPEDEPAPPPRGSTGAWLRREGRALSSDYVPWNSGEAMAWTVIAQGFAPAARLSAASLSLPQGTQAWAVSPSRRLKWRLSAGGNIPVTGDDTLMIYAGTPAALAKVSELSRSAEKPQAFNAALRAVSGGWELVLELPEAARVDVRLWTLSGRESGGFRDRALGAGRHVWPWASLGSGGLGKGVYVARIEARGTERTLRFVQALSVLH